MRPLQSISPEALVPNSAISIEYFWNIAIRLLVVLHSVLSIALPAEIGPWSYAAPDFPLPMGELPSLRAAAEQNGSTDFTPLWSGQAAALAREMPAKMLIDALVREATKFGGG